VPEVQTLDPKKGKFFILTLSVPNVAPEIAGHESNNGDFEKESGKLEEPLEEEGKENGPG